MLIRPLRPLDLVALASFQRRAGGTEIAAHTWPRVEPESGRLPYFQLASRALAQRPGARRAWVAEENGRLAGLAVARARAGGLVWDVVSLHAELGLEHAAGDLLEEVGAYAGAHAGRHDLFVKLLAARVREPRLVPANVVGG